MKQYIYYGTEENAFEIEKHETISPMEDIMEYLTNNGMNEEEAFAIADEILESVDIKGYDYYDGYADNDYTYVVGIANYGYCTNISKYLEERRKEMMYW